MAEKGSSTTRLEAFSDGVFAIAITLLILEIKTPSRIGILASGGLSHALAGNWESYVAYVMSFALIGIFWINHHSLFDYIKRTNRGVLIANLALLMCISFLPYPTAILAENLGDPSSRAVATAFYGLSLMACCLTSNILWWTAYGSGMLDASVDKAGADTITRRYAYAIPGYAAATALAFVNVWASLAIHGVLALWNTFSERRE